MAMEVATGVLSIDTGAATTQYSVTGLAFQPKAIILWWSGRADTGDASGEQDIQPGMGVAVSSSSRWAVTAQADHSPTTTATDKYHTDAACVAVLDTSGAAVGLADFVSFNSDGFTLVVDDAFPALVRVSYTALGGSDLTDIAAGMFQLASGTGNANYTGETSFTPDFALFTSINHDTAPPSGDVGIQISYGAATAAAQAVLANRTANNQATSITSSYCRSGEMLAFLSSVSAVGTRCSLTSFLSDGFQINKLEEGSPVSPYVFYLALKGGQYKIGDFVTATNTTALTEATGITGGAAKGAMFFSANRAASTQDACTAHLEWSIGAAVSGTARNAQYVRDKDASANADCFSAIEHDAIYINADNSAAQVIEGGGDLNSFDSNGDMTLQMDDADPVASFVWYIAFGDAAGVYTLDAQPGSFIITGVAATLARGLFINAAPGSYAITGFDTTLARGLFINAEPGSFLVTGVAAALLAGRVLIANPGSFAITGTAASLVASRVLSADPGNFTVTGFATGLLVARVLNAQPGSYAIVGTDATLLYTPLTGAFILNAEPGVYAITGAPASLLAARFMAANPGAYVITGFDTGLIYGPTLGDILQNPTGIPSVYHDGLGNLYVAVDTAGQPDDVPSGIPGVTATATGRLRVAMDSTDPIKIMTGIPGVFATSAKQLCITEGGSNLVNTGFTAVFADGLGNMRVKLSGTGIMETGIPGVRAELGAMRVSP